VFFVVSNLILNNLFYIIADIHHKISYQYLNNGNTNELIQELYKADFYNPNQSYYKLLLASVFIEINEIDLARIHLQKAADFESKHGDFYQFLTEKTY
jgi:Tfp pilus assembly protein PilF